jgi:hypothetical protein
LHSLLPSLFSNQTKNVLLVMACFLKKDPVVAEPEAPEIRSDSKVSNFLIARFHKSGQHVRRNNAMNRIEVFFTHNV